MIPHEYIEEVVRRNEISDVIGGYVQLKRKGRLHSGLCPFHSERSPSFYLYPDTQSFYCFGCGEGGDVISFIKKINNLDYVEAVKMLASRAGMAEPDEEDKVGKLRSRILAINKEAARFYHACLNSTTDEGKTARAYWRRRGLDDKTIVRFGLGYAPNNSRSTYMHLRDKGFTDLELLESGLIKRGEKGNIYNVFRNRVMTPIFDLRGNIIAFGGRVLDDSKPKYINSPETLVYKKSKTVFGLQIAKKSTDTKYVLCEGYMDVIAMYQAGIETAVCACGTALTAEQVKLLSDYAEEVVLCYDSDEAGQKASMRSLELFKNSPTKISVLEVPDVKDPDEYIKKYGPERFKQLLNGTGNAYEFKLGKIRQKYDIAKDNEKIEFLKEATLLLSQQRSQTEREVYAGALEEETGVSKTAIIAQLEDTMRRGDYKRRMQAQKDLLSNAAVKDVNVPFAAGGQKALGVAVAEQLLVVALIKNPVYLPMALKNLDVDSVVMPDIKEVLEVLKRYYNENTAWSFATLLSSVSDKTRTELSRLVAYYSEVNPTEQDVKMYLERIAHSTPKSAIAPKMSAEEHANYLQTLRDKKIAKPTE